MAITRVNLEGKLCWPAQMIQPIDEWLTHVYRLHMIVGSVRPGFAPSWIRSYWNNESPLYACQHNCYLAPGAFMDSAAIRKSPRYLTEMEMPPRAGIGELDPVHEFEP